MLNSTINPAINSALDNIRASLAHQKQVAFVFHSWMPFANLSLQGFKFPQVPEKQIPRLSLIPIVAITEHLMGSRVSTSTNRHIPVPVVYQKEIGDSLTDLKMRFSQFGLVELPTLATDVDQIDDSISIFSILTRGISQATNLELLPEYFGATSPVDFQFTKKRPLIKKTALDYLEDAVKAKEITIDMADRAELACQALGQSTSVAHIFALEPANGVLPKTIRNISDRLKFRFDIVDEWLVRQFPSFDSKGGLNQAQEQSGNDLLEKLVELLSAQKAPAVEPPTNSIPAGESLEVAEEEEEVKVQCQQIKKDGTQCKGTALEDSLFCRVHQVG
jgi:hypothetical protein